MRVFVTMSSLSAVLVKMRDAKLRAAALQGTAEEIWALLELLIQIVPLLAVFALLGVLWRPTF